MTDQFAESSGTPGAEQPDEGTGDGAEDDQLDEGYAPPGPWSGSDELAPEADRRAATGPLEQRLEQEDADVEDDWDEE